MGMGMSVRLAPGVRVRVSSRGVRTSVGPRVARLHVGGGATRCKHRRWPVRLLLSPGQRLWSIPGAVGV